MGPEITVQLDDLTFSAEQVQLSLVSDLTSGEAGSSPLVLHLMLPTINEDVQRLFHAFTNGESPEYNVLSYESLCGGVKYRTVATELKLMRVLLDPVCITFEIPVISSVPANRI